MPNRKVDVAINIYGKPYQTIVAINSLLKYSGKHINKIYFIVEKQQPNLEDIEIIKKNIQFENVEYFTPSIFLGWWSGKRVGLLNKILLYFKSYRYSIRYQYAFEKSKQEYLFVLHNDVIFYGDLIGKYLEQIESNIGIGEIGQCHNCPVFNIKCTPDAYQEYQPDLAEVMAHYRKFPELRAERNGNYKVAKKSWPLPECRLNEFAALINLKLAKKITVPYGKALPIGYFGHLDIGIDWFYDANNLGYRFKHFSFDQLAKHSWALPLRSSGHSSLFNKDQYILEETIAKELIDSNNF